MTSRGSGSAPRAVFPSPQVNVVSGGGASGGGASGGGASGGGASSGGASGGASGGGVRAANAASRRRVKTELGPSPKHDDMGVNHASSAFASGNTNNDDEAPTTHGGEVADSQKD